MKTIVVALAFALGFVGAVLAQQDDTVYKPGDGVSLPALVKTVSAHYTVDAMKRRVIGSVVMHCVVDREGVPTNLEIVESLDKGMDEEALKALKQWRFQPGKKNGQPVLVQISVQMAFSIPPSRGRFRWWRTS